MFFFMKFTVSVVCDSYKPKSTYNHQCDGHLGGVTVWIPHRYAKTDRSTCKTSGYPDSSYMFVVPLLPPPWDAPNMAMNRGPAQCWVLGAKLMFRGALSHILNPLAHISFSKEKT